MKIDLHVPGSVPAQTGTDARRRLSGETTFDRTLQQMESRMWRGAEAGHQPTAVLPHGLMQSPRSEQIAAAAMAAPPPTAAIPQGHRDDPMGAERVASGFEALLTIASAVTATTMPSTPSDAMGAALRQASPELRSAPDVPDRAGPSMQAAKLPTSDTILLPDSSRVTWIQSTAGTIVVLRHVRRGQVDLHFVRDALAQLRRHGLDPKRLIINGVMSPQPFPHGDPA